jgi:hypothetical protein
LVRVTLFGEDAGKNHGLYFFIPRKLFGVVAVFAVEGDGVTNAAVADFFKTGDDVANLTVFEALGGSVFWFVVIAIEKYTTECMKLKVLKCIFCLKLLNVA